MLFFLSAFVIVEQLQRQNQNTYICQICYLI